MVSDDELGRTAGNVIIEDDDATIVEDLKKDEDDQNIIDVAQVEDNSFESIEFDIADLAQEQLMIRELNILYVREILMNILSILFNNIQIASYYRN